MMFRKLIAFCAPLVAVCGVSTGQTLAISISGNGSIVRKVFGPNG
jgi:hypothetical protein